MEGHERKEDEDERPEAVDRTGHKTRSERDDDAIEVGHENGLPLAFEAKPEELGPRAYVPTPHGAILDFDEDRAVAVFEKAVKFLEKVKVLTLKMTRPKHWTNQDDGPYLTESGIHVVRPVWGIYLEQPSIEVDEHPDGHVTVRASGYGGSKVLNDRQWEEGSRCSRDNFFDGQKKWKTEKDPDTGHNRRVIAEGEHGWELGDVRKAALANLRGRLVRRILGLDNLTWDDIEKVVDWKRTDVPGVKREQGGGGGGARGRELTPEDKAKQLELSKKVLELAGGDAERAAAYLEKITTDPTGRFQSHRSTTTLSGPAIRKFLSVVGPVYREWKNSGDLPPELAPDPGSTTGVQATPI